MNARTKGCKPRGVHGRPDERDGTQDALEGMPVHGRLVVEQARVLEPHTADGWNLRQGVFHVARSTRCRGFHELDQALHERGLAQLAGHDGQRPLGRKHARNLTGAELGIEKVHGICHHHEIQTGVVEGQGLGHRVNRANRQATSVRLGAQPIEHRVRRLHGNDVEASFGQGQCHVPDTRAQIAHAAVVRRQRDQRIDQPRRVRRPCIVDVGYAIEHPPRGIMQAYLSTTKAHGAVGTTTSDSGQSLASLRSTRGQGYLE